MYYGCKEAHVVEIPCPFLMHKNQQ
ncbi:UNVERIFIED_CONTAM: hypothetical protein GTU68_067316 [Idotea baltica]|nr:hypothetical protein [Idotea baltica]